MDSSFEYQKEGLALELAEAIMRDYDVDIAKALAILYNSETYAKLNDPRTGLFFQSATYVYSFLRQELETGCMA